MSPKGRYVKSTQVRLQHDPDIVVETWWLKQSTSGVGDSYAPRVGWGAAGEYY
jgi:hypothetical protein